MAFSGMVTWHFPFSSSGRWYLWCVMEGFQRTAEGENQYVGESVQPFNKRMNGHRSDLTKKKLLPLSQHFVSPGHSLDDFGRSKIYIIEHNPSWKENQWQKKREFLDPGVTNITSGGYQQKGLNLLLFFYFLTITWALAIW